MVSGDLILLGPGDRLLVDGEVGESDGLEVDEPLLTGEADPMHKQPNVPRRRPSANVRPGSRRTRPRSGCSPPPAMHPRAALQEESTKLAERDKQLTEARAEAEHNQCLDRPRQFVDGADGTTNHLAAAALARGVR
ncbi:hypothetical protein [Nonomuraea sp. NPDC005650]|uniref:P-type ATPase n=1 Tax=Nonomuraea sp. NPDC005650 TaxID=3157045 RepID=UPI0033B30411